MLKQVAISTIRAMGHAALSPLELGLRGRADPDMPPPVFIIGPPRSGTTLLYEALITRFKLAYISNAAHRFYQTPLAATWLMRQGIRNWKGDFSSSMGHISGWNAPNEGGLVWRRWLIDGDWHDGSGLQDQTIADLRQFTAAMSAVLDAPFLNKNVMHSNRLLAMQRIWPDARYLVVKRDVTENARSIIRAFRKGAGPAVGGGEWRSVRPRLAGAWDGRSLAARAVAQAIGVNRDITTDSAAMDQQRFLPVDYSTFCADPASIMAKIADFLETTGGCPQIRNALPEKFSASSRHLDASEEQEILSARKELDDG